MKKEKTVHIELFRDPRFGKRVKQIEELIEKKFVTMVKNHFHSNVDEFHKWWRSFGIYANNASKMKLSKEDAKNFALMRKNLNTWMGISCEEIRKINTRFRFGGKIMRIPVETLEAVLSQEGYKTINHGKNFESDYHWCKKYMPKPERFEDVFARWMPKKETAKSNLKVEIKPFEGIRLDNPEREIVDDSKFEDIIFECFNERKADENRLSDR